MNLESKAQEEIFPDPQFKPTMFAWDLDNQGFYFSVTRTSDYLNEAPGADFLYYYDLKTKNYTEVNLDWDWGLFYLGFQARSDGFIASLANGARPKWRRYYRKGKTYEYQDLEGKHAANLYRLVLHRTKDIAIYQFTTASTPPQWYLGRLQGHGQPLGKNAWMPEDQKTKETPPLNYIGLRVVKEIRVKKEPS